MEETYRSVEKRKKILHPRSILHSSLLVFIINIFLQGKGVILAILYTNLLIPSEVGLLSLFLTISSFSIVIGSFGLRGSFLRFTASELSREVISRNFFSTVIPMLGFTIILLFAVILSLGNTNISFSENPYLPHILLICAISFLIKDICYVFFASFQKTKIYFFTVISSEILGIVFILMFALFGNNSASSVLLSFSISNLMVFIPIFLNIVRSLWPITIDLATIKHFLKFGLPLNMTSISIITTAQIGIIFIGILGDLTNVAIFYIANTLVSVLLIFTGLWNFTLAPTLYSLNDSNKGKFRVYKSLFLKYELIILFTASILLVGFSKIISHLLFGAEYEGVSKFTLFLVLGVIFRIMIHYPSLDAEIANKTHLQFIAAIMTLVLAIIINFFLIRWLNIFGAVLSVLISSVANFLILFVITQKISSQQYEWGNVFKIILIAIPYLVLVSLVEFNLNDWIANTVFVLLMVLVLIGSLFLFKVVNKNEVSLTIFRDF